MPLTSTFENATVGVGGAPRPMNDLVLPVRLDLNVDTLGVDKLGNGTGFAGFDVSINVVVDGVRAASDGVARAVDMEVGEGGKTKSVCEGVFRPFVADSVEEVEAVEAPEVLRSTLSRRCRGGGTSRLDSFRCRMGGNDSDDDDEGATDVTEEAVVDNEDRRLAEVFVEFDVDETDRSTGVGGTITVTGAFAAGAGTEESSDSRTRLTGDGGTGGRILRVMGLRFDGLGFMGGCAGKSKLERRAVMGGGEAMVNEVFQTGAEGGGRAVVIPSPISESLRGVPSCSSSGEDSSV